MPDDCIFCKIVSGQIPAEKIISNEEVIVINDIHPAAPKHMLIIPKEHFSTLNDIPKEKSAVLVKIFDAAKEAAKKTGISEEGYRVIVNTNRAAGQEVFHLHFHVMGGRNLGSMG